MESLERFKRFKDKRDKRIRELETLEIEVTKNEFKAKETEYATEKSRMQANDNKAESERNDAKRQHDKGMSYRNLIIIEVNYSGFKTVEPPKDKQVNIEVFIFLPDYSDIFPFVTALYSYTGYFTVFILIRYTFPDSEKHFFKTKQLRIAV